MAATDWKAFLASAGAAAADPIGAIVAALSSAAPYKADVAVAPTDGQVYAYSVATGLMEPVGVASPANLFGDGSDGAATCDGAAAVAGMSRSGSVYTMNKDVFFTNLTVNTGVTVNTGGFRIFCTDTLTNSGTIQNLGVAGAANGTAGAAAAGQTVGPSSAGGAGNTGAGTAGGSSSASNAAIGLATAVAGAGGTGSSGAAGAAGFSTGGTSMFIYRIPFPILTGVSLYASLRPLGGGVGGGGGGGDGTNKGGGGGSGGGLIAIFAKTFINNAGGVLSVAGGAGGTPTTGNCGGGGGGTGGIIIVYTTTAWTQSGTLTISGGAAGSGVGTGTAGGAGTAGNSLNVVLS